MGELIKQVAALLLGATYMLANGFSRLAAHLRWVPVRNNDCFLVIGTFYNYNWFLSHIAPLTTAGFSEVILITDSPVETLPGLRYVCPFPALTRFFPRTSRALCKMVLAVLSAARFKPAFVMGYHIFPLGVICRIAASICGGKAIYQSTSGARELQGGGWQDDHPILGRLGRPVPWLERAAVRFTNHFDLVIVRGTSSMNAFRSLGVKTSLKILTGSVALPAAQAPLSERSIDVLFVGRLEHVKRLDRWLRIVARLARQWCDIRTVLVGDGSLRNALHQQIVLAGLDDNVTLVGRQSDVMAYYQQSKVFLLTSDSEGMSIAMMEGMANGVVPVVSQVGDLDDLVVHGENGYLIEPHDIDGFIVSIAELLDDDQRWTTHSKAAYSALQSHTREALAQRWNSIKASLMKIQIVS